MNDTVRDEKQVGELESGDWLSAFALKDDFAAEVLSAHPYRDSVLLVLAEQDGDPFMQRWSADRVVPLATDDERSAGRALRTRLDVSRILRELSELVASTDVPVEGDVFRGTLQFHVRDVAEVERVSKLLDTPIVVDSAGRHSAYWPREAKSPLRAEWFQYRRGEEPGADDTGLGYSREQDNGDPAAVVPEGVVGTPLGIRPASGAPVGDLR